MTPFELGQRFVGMKEAPGTADQPFIRWCHSLCSLGEMPDSVPWCSSWVNAIAWMLSRPRSKSAAARSWLEVGASVDDDDAYAGSDVVILSRGGSPTAGHVGFFAGWDLGESGQRRVRILGGNQNDAVSIESFDADSILGIRRI